MIRKEIASVPESLTQLVETIVFYMLEPQFDLWIFHLFVLWVDFQATKLPDKKKIAS
jgi:hypothetical protein